MQARRLYAVPALVVMMIAVVMLRWYMMPKQDHIAPQEGRILRDLATNEVISSSDLGTAAAIYQEEQNYRTRCAIAKSFAETQTHFWEACARRRMGHFDERQALQHFADAYFKRGLQQREELTSLLRSQDEELIAWLLLLLGETCELGPNGEWRPDKGLGGSEIAHCIASVYKTHPSLGVTIASTLGNYGYEAKSEIKIVLSILLMTFDSTKAFVVKVALRQIDADGVCTRFGIDSAGNLTDDQKLAIGKYLALQNE